ncbi:Retrovirus-related Pol polyprotein from transposon RE1 [Linum grandiflorum]
MEFIKDDSIAACFDGKNYALWEHQFRVHVQGKALLSYLTGEAAIPDPPAAAADSTSTWQTNNAKVVSWILGSVTPHISLSLCCFIYAADIWKHLKQTYAQVNTSRQFEIEYELAKLGQGDMDIHGYYLAASQLWTEQDLMTASLHDSATSAVLTTERNQSRILHFLMRLRPEFEQVRATLVSNNVANMEQILGELVRAETRFSTQAQIDSPTQGSLAFAAQRNTFTNRRTTTLAAPSNNLADAYCRHCSIKGHSTSHCRKRNFCNYCKTPGHIILDCPILKNRPAKQVGRGAFSVNPAPSTESAPLTANSIEALVQSALAKLLPTALNSAFATTSGKLWHVDSAAYNHMTGDRSLFRKYDRVENMGVRVASGDVIPVAGEGSISSPSLSLDHVLHVPRLAPNLLSVGQLIDGGCRVIFGPTGCSVQDHQTRKEIGHGSKHGRTFYLRKLGSLPLLPSCGSALSCNVVSGTDVASWRLWHSRLGHPHSGRLSTMLQNQLLPISFRMKEQSIPVCTHCIEAKTIKQSFGISSTEIFEPFHLVHTDLWGPAPVVSRLGYRYFALFIDHATRYTWIYFIRFKSELLMAAQEFVQMIQTQFQKTVKMIRSDPGGEFSSRPLHQFYKEHGILYQMSCPGVSEQNGLVERKHRHVLDLTRALLLESKVPATFWQEAVHTVIYLINRQITPTLNDVSPLYALYSRQPAYDRLRIFGCVCFVLLPPQERTKLTTKTARCVFLGYSDNHKGYMCYDPALRRMRIAYHVLFLEDLYYYADQVVGTTPIAPSLDSFFEADVDTNDINDDMQPSIPQSPPSLSPTVVDEGPAPDHPDPPLEPSTPAPCRSSRPIFG